MRVETVKAGDVYLRAAGVCEFCQHVRAPVLVNVMRSDVTLIVCVAHSVMLTIALAPIRVPIRTELGDTTRLEYPRA